MRNTRMLRRATVPLAAAALTLGLGTATAHADPGIPDIGIGHANNPQSVRCVQFFVNNYLNLHLLEDGKFGPQTEYGVKKLQKFSNYHWATSQLVIDGIFGKHTGEVVLKHIKRYPLSIDYRKATRCAHKVPSYNVILN